jgi:hypothetical protein
MVQRSTRKHAEALRPAAGDFAARRFWVVEPGLGQAAACPLRIQNHRLGNGACRAMACAGTCRRTIAVRGSTPAAPAGRFTDWSGFPIPLDCTNTAAKLDDAANTIPSLCGAPAPSLLIKADLRFRRLFRWAATDARLVGVAVATNLPPSPSGGRCIEPGRRPCASSTSERVTATAARRHRRAPFVVPYIARSSGPAPRRRRRRKSIPGETYHSKLRGATNRRWSGRRSRGGRQHQRLSSPTCPDERAKTLLRVGDATPERRIFPGKPINPNAKNGWASANFVKVCGMLIGSIRGGRHEEVAVGWAWCRNEALRRWAALCRPLVGT